MFEPSLLLAKVAGTAAKVALSDAAKQRLKGLLSDTLRVQRAIQKAANEFSTRLPGARDALEAWANTEAFRAAIDDLVSGGLLPEQIADPDGFFARTGLGFGGASPENIRALLAAFFRNIREDLLSSHQGLVLLDNRIGELQREFQALRADLAAQNAPDISRVNVQLTSTELLHQIAQTQGWGVGLGYGPDIHVNLELPPTVQNLITRARAVRRARDIFANTAWYAIYGGSGSGKTQLAILIASSFSGHRIWIRLGSHGSAAGLILEAAFSKLAKRQPGQTISGWYDTVCGRLEPDSLIVIDDLPHMSADTALSAFNYPQVRRWLPDALDVE